MTDHAQGLERIDRGRGQAQVALVEHLRQARGRRGLDHGHVEGLDEEDDENVLLEGEAFSIAEDIEHARREAEAKRPGQGK